MEIFIYCIDLSALLENTPLIKFIRNCIQDPSGVFSIYYIDTDEITGFLFLLKKIISSTCAVNISFLSFTCENIGVVMVKNMISQ